MNKIVIVGLVIMFVLGFGISYFIYYVPINNVETFSIIVANDNNFTDVIHQKNVTWNELSFGKHTIKLIAFDMYGNRDYEEIEVWKFF